MISVVRSKDLVNHKVELSVDKEEDLLPRSEPELNNVQHVDAHDL